MLNATVRAAATGLPTAIFNRRRMLLGLAAASTAAAGPIAVAAGTQAPAESAEMLDLGARTAFVLANYRQVVESRQAIAKEWGPKWPSPSEDIRLNTSLSRAVLDLEGNYSPTGESVWSRKALLESIAFSRNRLNEKKRKGTRPETIARYRAAWQVHVGEREALLASLDAYEAECEAIRNASGIRSAQKSEQVARDTLLAHVRAVMALEPATMAGVLIQAEALEAVADVPAAQRITWQGNSVRFQEGYGERIAASILRIAGNA